MSRRSSNVDIHCKAESQSRDALEICVFIGTFLEVTFTFILSELATANSAGRITNEQTMWPTVIIPRV